LRYTARSTTTQIVAIAQCELRGEKFFCYNCKPLNHQAIPQRSVKRSPIDESVSDQSVALFES
jgi:hypothetical protein